MTPPKQTGPNEAATWWLSAFIEKHGVAVVLNCVILWMVWSAGSYVGQRMFSDSGYVTKWVEAQIAATEHMREIMTELAAQFEGVVVKTDNDERARVVRVDSVIAAQTRIEAKLDAVLGAKSE